MLWLLRRRVENEHLGTLLFKCIHYIKKNAFWPNADADDDGEGWFIQDSDLLDAMPFEYLFV